MFSKEPSNAEQTEERLKMAAGGEHGLQQLLYVLLETHSWSKDPG